MNNDKQKQILIEIMEADAKDKLYAGNHPFRYASLREITDQCERGEISYGRMVEMLNDIAIKWHENHIGDTNKMVEHHIVDANKMINVTPKEKALELYNTCYDYTQGDYNCKQCALVAVDWLLENIQKVHKMDWDLVFIQAKEMEKQQRIKDYNAGFDDAKCNHINDADNYANEIEYIQSRIDEIDIQIKTKQNNIADMLINGNLNSK
jgi:hypothetical protein